MTEEEAFLEAILTEADDHVSRLAFADWLNERDDPRESIVRAQGELGPSIELSAGPKLVPIPAGSFTMGSPDTERYRDPDEAPHKVVLTRPYYLAATPVTVGEFREFVQSTGYETVAELTAGIGWNSVGGHWEHGAYWWGEPGWALDDEEPVVCLAWEDALAYCAWLNRLDGREYRLPSEAEWEYACRAWTTTPYYFGQELAASEANYYPGRPTPVRDYPPNAFGLYDMHGNVWEWCNDWYGESYYYRSARRNPPGPASGSARVLRGGAWCLPARDCRSALRRCGNVHASRFQDGATGIRIAMTMPSLPRRKKKR